MSQTETRLPDRVERKINNRGDDAWNEYNGEPLFNDDAERRVRQRFREMVGSDYEPIATVKGSSVKKTKIRTKDLQAFTDDLVAAVQAWIDTHGPRLTNFGNAYYGEILDDYAVVEINEEKPRKTVLWAQYDAGHKVAMGGANGKKQSILLPIRDYEQWSYHTEVVEPLFTEYNDKYPY